MNATVPSSQGEIPFSRRLLARLAGSRVAGPALALVTCFVCLVVVEAALRLVGYRYSPLTFLPAATPADARPIHMGGEADRITEFDPEVLWAFRPGYRVRPGAPPLVNAQGLRGTIPSEPRHSSEFVILALGDSNTAGPRDASGNWPDDLQRLVELNAPAGRSFHVLNAGVYGYTAFQGLRRLRQLVRYRADLVFVSFGANNGHFVRLADDEYARRMAFLAGMPGLRVLPPLTQLLYDARDRVRGRSSEVMRVSPDAYRRHLEEIVDVARSHGASVVLLTRPYVPRAAAPGDWMFHAPVYRGITEAVARAKGVPCVDVYAAFAGRTALFQDESHLTREGYLRMAELLLAHLARAGVVAGRRLRASAVDLGSVSDQDPELGGGFWPAEAWGGGLRGRWTRDRACVELERQTAENRVEVDLTVGHRRVTEVEIEVGGVRVARLEAGEGRHALRGDLAAFPRGLLGICVTARPTFVPSALEAGSRDERTLGVFVHRMALVP